MLTECHLNRRQHNKKKALAAKTLGSKYPALINYCAWAKVTIYHKSYYTRAFNVVGSGEVSDYGS